MAAAHDETTQPRVSPRVEQPPGAIAAAGDPDAAATEAAADVAVADVASADTSAAGGAAEIGGPAGPEPTRFGDWERKGRCIDF